MYAVLFALSEVRYLHVIFLSRGVILGATLIMISFHSNMHSVQYLTELAEPMNGFSLVDGFLVKSTSLSNILYGTDIIPAKDVHFKSLE